MTSYEDMNEMTNEELMVQNDDMAVDCGADVTDVEVVRAASMLPNRKGMTLVEIMIVLTILAGIMVAVGVYAFDALDRANIAQTRVKLEKISSKVQEFYAFQSPSAMPDNISDLTSPPGGEPAYLRDQDIKDSWGNPISYSKSGNRAYELRSPGPNGSEGDADDVVLSSGE